MHHYRAEGKQGGGDRERKKERRSEEEKGEGRRFREDVSSLVSFSVGCADEAWMILARDTHERAPCVVPRCVIRGRRAQSVKLIANQSREVRRSLGGTSAATVAAAVTAAATTATAAAAAAVAATAVAALLLLLQPLQIACFFAPYSTEIGETRTST